MEPVTTALTALSVEGVKTVVRSAWAFATRGKADQDAVRREADEAFAHAVRLLGSALFEMRANIERVRLMVLEAKKDGFGVNFGVYDFTVTDALMADLCRIAPSPPLVESCRSILSALRRIDFFQRLAGESADLRKYGYAIGFAEDAIKKGIIERFNTSLTSATGLPQPC